VASVFLIASFVTLPIVWYLAKELFNNKKVAYIAVILYAFSPLFQLSTRWLSNPVLSLLCMPFLLLLLWGYINKQSTKTALLLGVIYGIVIQSQLAFLLLLIFLPIYLLIFKIKPSLKQILSFAIGLFMAMSSIIIGEIKYGFQGTSSLLQFLTKSHKAHNSINATLEHILEKINSLISVSSIALPSYLPLFILLILTIVVLRSKTTFDKKPLIFIGVWLLNLIIFTFFDTGISRSLFVFYPSLVMIIILSAYLLERVISQKFLLLIVLIGIITSQVLLSMTWIKDMANPLTVQRGITLSEEQKILDYTYTSSSDKPFSINTVTEPLFINTTWAYLYKFYGERNYGYLPFWIGKDQTGNLGELPLPTSPTTYHYLIIEPTTGIPDYFVKAAISEEDAKSKIIEEKHFGNFVVQKRQTLEAKF
jgi:4-amino-4-deoxy-L-arabinose transferase-like glycosyltransferase